MVTRTWTGGTGTWDLSTGTHWSGGVAPTTGDSVVFDGTSGGGVVTAAANISGLSLADITSGAFTGTLDFSVNNPNLTLTSNTGFNANGSGVRKYLMGSGTFTFTSAGFVWLLAGSNIDVTSSFTANYTFATTSTFATSFTGAGKTYGTLTVSANTSRGPFDMVGSNTFSNMALAAGTNLRLQTGTTTTVSNAFTWTGTSASPIYVFPDNSNSGTVPIISVASGTSTITWGAIYESAASGGGTFNATNSLDLGRNTGWSITAPSVGGGGAGSFFGA